MFEQHAHILFSLLALLKNGPTIWFNIFICTFIFFCIMFIKKGLCTVKTQMSPFDVLYQIVSTAN